MDQTLSLLITVQCLDAVKKRLGKITAKAGLEVQTVPGLTYLTVDAGVIECARLTVGSMPRLNGWALVARIEHTQAGNIVANAPGETCPVEWRQAGPVCSHCGTKRERKNTYVLRGPEGNLVQIGHNCLSDFLMVDAAVMVKRAEASLLVSTLAEGEWSGFGGCRPEWSTAAYVACAVSSTRREGFRKAGETGATRDSASFLCAAPPFGDSESARATRKEWQAGQPTAEDLAVTAQILAWTPDTASDYGHNLSVALKCPAAGAKRLGLLASAPSAYFRAMGKQRSATSQPAAATGGFWGEVGERAEVQATLKSQFSIDGQYGTIVINRFLTDAGQVLVWFASGACPKSDCLGRRYSVKGTVKRHMTRKGEAQTVLSRCAWTCLEPEAKPEAKPVPAVSARSVASDYCALCDRTHAADMVHR